MGLSPPTIFGLNSVVSFMVSTLFLAVRKPDVVMVSVPSCDVGLGVITACKLVRARCVVDYREEWEDCAISLNNSRNGEFFYSAVKKLVSSLCGMSLSNWCDTKFYSVFKTAGMGNVGLMPNWGDIGIFKPFTRVLSWFAT